jgi:hypothetical protein
MAGSGKIIDLRKLLAERFPHPAISPSARLPTGLSFIDSIIGSGSASVISALLQTAERAGYFVALIDGRDSFDPEPLGNSCLRHLLWMRCRKAVEVIKAADLLLRDGNFPLVIADLVFNPVEELRKIPQTSWYRLQRLVEPTSTAFLVLARHSMGSSAQLKIILENAWTWQRFNQENPLSCIRVRVQRSHIHHLAMATGAAS